MSKKLRITEATKRRMASVHLLVAKLKEGGMTRDEISGFLGVGQTYGRGFIKQLENEGILIGSPSVQNQQRVYSLNPNEQHVAAILAARYTPKAGPISVPKPSGRIVIEDGTSHVHVMADDMAYKPKTKFRIPPHCDLMNYFYALDGGTA